ncbi:MAG: 16S rRNA (cytosine(1402)-N(4))-methyltransferase RsmH [Bacteroidales bacterium]|nr:16S rRNA (cytosine(1402)-N(4))-methyltransferase RsmH [Bacteroidales bacterium]
MMPYHTPVLLAESVAGLAIRPDGVYVDVTFGSGQSSRAILSQLGPEGRLYAFDQDEDAQANRIEDGRFTLISANFSHIRNFLQFYGVEQVNGILADLGVSSHQFDVPERGFSTRFDGPLDMRMDRRKSLTAADVLATYGEEELARLFSRYGEVFNAKRLAAQVVKARAQRPLTQTSQLKELLSGFVPKSKENRYFAQVYQALRMEVNAEWEALEALLTQSVDLLLPGGRLVVISYHSIEDRLVKQFLRSGNVEGKEEKDFYGNPLSPFRVITRKAIVPPAAELQVNNRSRSARLRIGEKKQQDYGQSV